VVALFANLVVAAAKLVAGLITGSAALLAEAAHSTADSVNELLLGLSLKRGRRPSDAVHPLGHGGARFLWAFIATIASFLIGGCLSIALAVRELLVGTAVERYLVAWVVLAVAFVAEGTSLLQSLAQARREAALWDGSTVDFLRHTSEPTLRAIVVEDAAALIGLGLAAVGLLLHEFAGLKNADAIAALLIGLLLAATAFGLARPLADLLIGRSMLPARLERVYAIIEGSPSIDEVLSVQAVERLNPDPQVRREIPDAGMPSLYLVIHPTGRKAWCVRYRFGGRTRKMTLGPYPALDLATARIRARDAIQTITLALLWQKGMPA